MLHRYAAAHGGRYPKAVFCTKLQARRWDIDIQMTAYTRQAPRNVPPQIMGAWIIEANCPLMFSDETQ